MATHHSFADEKNALIQQLLAVNNPAFFDQLRAMLDQFHANQTHRITQKDKLAIAEGRADVAAGKVESWEAFRKHFVKYEL